MRRIVRTFNISAVTPYINWLYFFHTWQMSGVYSEARSSLMEDAMKLLQESESRYKSHAIFCLYKAVSDGDDIIFEDRRIPFLRQQHRGSQSQPNICMSDFIKPAELGSEDYAGLFATTVDMGFVEDNSEDGYMGMLAQSLADRIAEATAELLHERVRKTHWGYAPNENLTPLELHRCAYQGIRPAVGYPSMPDLSINFIINDIIGMDSIGISLTENGMMIPHSSVSGLMLAHRDARYFDIGRIGYDQFADYCRRRGFSEEKMRKFLSANLEV